MRQKELGQFFTPAWAAEILFDAHFSHLTEKDLVWEPTCGTGSLLAAIPNHIPCIGTELDPVLAMQARVNSGRSVAIGDCRTVDLDQYQVTAVFGNPPFNYKLFEQLMDRCSRLLQTEQKAGFVLPAYFLQTSRTVRDLCRNWSIHQEIIPRDIFPGLSKPLVFALFIRDNFPRLFGFRLFKETAEIKDLPFASQERFANIMNGSRSVWKAAVLSVLNELGGEADLKSIYKAIEGKRPTGTTWWKEKVRQTLQQSFVKVSGGIYSSKFQQLY